MLKAAVLALPLSLGLGGIALATSAAAPLIDVSVSERAGCPASKSSVVMSAGAGDGQVGFTIYKDGQYVNDGLLNPNTKRTIKVAIPRGGSARIAVEIVGQGTSNYSVKSKCARGDRPQNANWWDRWDRDHDELPFTGPPTDLWGKIAIAGGLLIMGGIFWWYGWVWPRQTPEYRRSA